MTTIAGPEPGDDAPGFARRLNLWLGKFDKPATAKAYADDLGIPHEAREFYAASAVDTPKRRGRKRGTFRKGTAFFPWCAERGLEASSTPPCSGKGSPLATRRRSSIVVPLD